MRTVFFAISAILCGLLAAYLLFPESFKSHKELPILTSIGGDFTLPSTVSKNNNGLAQLSDFQGKIVLLNFGFTYCPDVCPMVLGRIKVLMEQIDPEGKIITPIFVSFDPQRDTIERLKEYLNFFNPNIVGMTANEQALKQLQPQYKLIIEKKGDDKNYIFSHTDFIYLIDRHGQVRALFSLDDSIDSIQQTIERLL